MRQPFGVLFVGSIVCATAGPVRGEDIPPQPVSGAIQWVYDYGEGKKISRQTGKPMFVVFRCER